MFAGISQRSVSCKATDTRPKEPNFPDTDRNSKARINEYNKGFWSYPGMLHSLTHQEICIGYGIIEQSPLQEQLQNLTGGTSNDVELIKNEFLFLPVTGKSQNIKIDEKLTNFGNVSEKKVKKSPLFLILWHLYNQVSALDH